MARLDGRTAIVTGGAVGIGRHYSEALAAEGAQVMIADIKDGSALAAEIAAKHGRNSTDSMVFDVSDESQCKALVAKTIERFGKIDILINNAALYAPLPTLKVTEIDVELWDKVMGINIRGPFLMVKHVAPHMIAKKYGKIVNIGSGTVARGIPDFSHYVTSKGAVTAFTRSVSRELGVHGICVNTLAPGYTLSDTGLTNTVHVEQSKAAAIVRRAIKRDQFPEDLLNPDLSLFQRQRLHDRPGAGGRWRRQQHLTPAKPEYLPRRGAPVFDDGRALSYVQLKDSGIPGDGNGRGHAGQGQGGQEQDCRQERRGCPCGLLRPHLQARHGAALGCAEGHHPGAAEDGLRAGDLALQGRAALRF